MTDFVSFHSTGAIHLHHRYDWLAFSRPFPLRPPPIHDGRPRDSSSCSRPARAAGARDSVEPSMEVLLGYPPSGHGEMKKSILMGSERRERTTTTTSATRGRRRRDRIDPGRERAAAGHRFLLFPRHRQPVHKKSRTDGSLPAFCSFFITFPPPVTLGSLIMSLQVAPPALAVPKPSPI